MRPTRNGTSRTNGSSAEFVSKKGRTRRKPPHLLSSILNSNSNEVIANKPPDLSSGTRRPGALKSPPHESGPGRSRWSGARGQGAGREKARPCGVGEPRGPDARAPRHRRHDDRLPPRE